MKIVDAIQGKMDRRGSDIKVVGKCAMRHNRAFQTFCDFGQGVCFQAFTEDLGSKANIRVGEKAHFMNQGHQ